MSSENQENVVHPAENEQITRPEASTKTSTKTTAQRAKDPKKLQLAKNWPSIIGVPDRLLIRN